MRILSSSAALVLVGGLLSAQATTAPAAQKIQQFEGELQHYKLHYKTGTLTRVDDPIQVPGTVQNVSTPTFPNNCNVTSFLPLGTSELVDWGVKSGGVSEIVDSFVFGYATDIAGPAVGGPGPDVEISFYEGNTGFGTLGTEVARFLFTGLPGSTTGGIAGFFITVDLAGTPGFCLPDGPIGYGYCTPNVLSSTGPILVDVTVCTGLGTIDAFDDYLCPASADPVANYVGTFNLGTPNISSFFIEINEDDASEVATTTVNNGTGINPVLLSDGGVAPVIGQVWPVTIDNTTSGFDASFGLWTLGSLGSPLFLAGGEVILNLLDPNGFVITNSVFAQSVNDHSALVVKDLTLIGLDLTCQGLLISGQPGFQLTNAIDLHLGF